MLDCIRFSILLLEIEMTDNDVIRNFFDKYNAVACDAKGQPDYKTASIERLVSLIQQMSKSYSIATKHDQPFISNDVREVWFELCVRRNLLPTDHDDNHPVRVAWRTAAQCVGTGNLDLFADCVKAFDEADRRRQHN